MEEIDLTQTIQADSDQLCASDLSEPRVFQVLEVFTTGDDKKPIAIRLDDHDHPWLPSKTSRRVLVAIWGSKGRDYVGRFLRLYNDPSVIFGGKAVGGVRINGATHIDSTKSGTLPFSRGKYKEWTVQPIDPPAPKQDPNRSTRLEKIAAGEKHIGPEAVAEVRAAFGADDSDPGTWNDDTQRAYLDLLVKRAKG